MLNKTRFQHFGRGRDVGPFVHYANFAQSLRCENFSIAAYQGEKQLERGGGGSEEANQMRHLSNWHATWRSNMQTAGRNCRGWAWHGAKTCSLLHAWQISDEISIHSSETRLKSEAKFSIQNVWSNLQQLVLQVQFNFLYFFGCIFLA